MVDNKIFSDIPTIPTKLETMGDKLCSPFIILILSDTLICAKCKMDVDNDNETFVPSVKVRS